MKQAFFEAAKKLKEDNFPAVFAAVDGTQNAALAKRENVDGYPTCMCIFPDRISSNKRQTLPACLKLY